MKKAHDPFIRVLVKRPGLPLRAEVVENTLPAMQALVNGYIECITVTTTLAIVCNEEGRLLGLPVSVRLLGTEFVGPVAFVGTQGEEFCDIRRRDERLVREMVEGTGEI